MVYPTVKPFYDYETQGFCDSDHWPIRVPDQNNTSIGNYFILHLQWMLSEKIRLHFSLQFIIQPLSGTSSGMVCKLHSADLFVWKLF